MVKCKAKEPCFYNGKYYKEGQEFNFNGPAKDLPKYLEQVKEANK